VSSYHSNAQQHFDVDGHRPLTSKHAVSDYVKYLAVTYYSSATVLVLYTPKFRRKLEWF